MTKTSLTEAFRNHPAVHLDHIVPLDFESIQTVPDSHLWPKCDGFDLDDRLPIPVVDLAGLDASNLIGIASEEWGVFQVINHGIPLELLDEVESEAIRLFSLPAKQKVKALRAPNGATGYGVARIAPFFDKCMWHEGFTMMGSPIDHARVLWPCDFQRFCDIMEAYQKRMNELATTLLHMIYRYLHIPKEETEQLFPSQGASSTGTLQLNSYPSCSNPEGAMGLAPHTDTSLFTILHQNNVKGLQYFKEGVGWVLVKPTKGALVVNIGDLLHILSNARFLCVLHRVALQEPYKQRLSVAYFCNPPVGFNLSPLGLRFGHLPKYRAMSVLEYFGIKAQNLDKSLSLIRIGQ